MRVLFLPLIWAAWGSFVLISTLWFAYTDVNTAYADAQESCTIIAEQWELERYKVSAFQAGETELFVSAEGYGASPENQLPITLRNVTGETIGAGKLEIESSGRNLTGSTVLAVNADISPSRATLFVADTPIGSVKIAQPPQQKPTPKITTDVIFGDQIRLLGYDLEGDRLTLYWEAVGGISADYTRFIHLLDANDQLISQEDAAPTYPTGIWGVGEIVTDEITLLSTNFTAIAVGWYQPQPFENLLLPNGAGRYLLP